MVRPAFSLLLVATLLLACGAPTPTTSPASAPSGVPTAAPRLNVTLTTDSQSYKSGEVVIQITLTNHGDEPVYLPVCGPWSVVDAATLAEYWIIECEIDYLGHKVEPGDSLAGSLEVSLDEGSYRVHTRLYSDCTLGEPKTISPRETYYGEFHACTLWEEIVSDPFDVE